MLIHRKRLSPLNAAEASPLQRDVGDEGVGIRLAHPAICRLTNSFKESGMVTFLPCSPLTRFYFVMFQNPAPQALRLQDQFHHFAHCPRAAYGRGDIMRLALYFGARVRHRDGEAHAVHDHGVGEIVADVGHLLPLQHRLNQNFLEDRNLLDMPLIHVRHLHLAGALRGGGRLASADHARLDAVPVEPCQANPILRIEPLRFHDVSIWSGYAIEFSIGEDAVHIHQQQLDARSAVLNLHWETGEGYNRTVLQRVAEVITRYNMFARGARLGVAVSGGADSVCLLRLLSELAREWNLALTVLHLDHGLRGEESRADAAFVEKLAADLGWPAVVRDAHLDTSENLEQAAREARISFFRDLMRDRELACVATGHTRDDQAETVLFRFLRGAGTAGLAGVRPVTRQGIVRPLIETRRNEIEAWLRAGGFGWRDDSTNFTLAFARNRIRAGLLPQLEREWNPALRQTLFQTAEWARAEESYWEAEIGRLAASCLTQADGFVFTDVERLAKLPLAAARRMVRRAIEGVKGDLRGIEFVHVEAILAMSTATEGHGRVQAAGIDVFRSFNRLRFGPVSADGLSDRNYRTEAPVPGIARVPAAGIAISLELLEKAAHFNPVTCVYNEDVSWVDCDRLSGSLILRNWRPGDQYQPVGRPRAEKIKTMFQEFRIPLWERRHWPVLIDGESIVWARQFGVAARFAAGSESRRVLQVREPET